MPNEKAIVNRLKKGEMSSVETIVNQYYDDIYKYLYTKTWSKADAEELTQEVFIKFISTLNNYKEYGKIKNYLYKIAYTTANDLFRRNKRNPLSEFIDIDSIEEKVSGIPGPFEEASKASTRWEIQRALQTLPQSQRDVVILRVYQELSFREIATVTGSNLSSVKSRYRQALNKLKRCQNLIDEVKDHDDT